MQVGASKSAWDQVSLAGAFFAASAAAFSASISATMASISDSSSWRSPCSFVITAISMFFPPLSTTYRNYLVFIRSNGKFCNQAVYVLWMFKLLKGASDYRCTHDYTCANSPHAQNHKNEKRQLHEWILKFQRKNWTIAVACQLQETSDNHNHYNGFLSIYDKGPKQRKKKTPSITEIFTN